MCRCDLLTRTTDGRHSLVQVIGNGSFGVVSLAQLCDEKKTPVAIKKVLQDRRYKVRPFHPRVGNSYGAEIRPW